MLVGLKIRPVLNKAQRWVKMSIEDIKNTIPYKMLGIDSDNGSEFKNYQLVKWCEDNEITFTRGRLLRKMIIVLLNRKTIV